MEDGCARRFDIGTVNMRAGDFEERNSDERYQNEQDGSRLNLPFSGLTPRAAPSPDRTDTMKPPRPRDYPY